MNPSKPAYLLTVLLLLCVHPRAAAQEWDAVKADPSYLWGEGWGRSVEEADGEALAALASRISVAVRSEFSTTESQRVTALRREWESETSRTLSVRSASRLSGTSMVVLRSGRKAHVGRWIRRDELDVLLSDRRDRVLEYEALAVEAERQLRLNDALRYHWWAWTVLRSLGRPSEIRDAEGRMLSVAIPERMNAILAGLSVGADRRGDELSLSFRYNGALVRGLDVSVFDGSGWSPLVAVKGGRATVRLAPGALAEVVQMRVEYAYRADACLEEDLRELLAAADPLPLKRAMIIFKR